MAPPKSPAGEKPAPKKPAATAQATEMGLEPVVSNQTTVSRVPEGPSSATTVTRVPEGLSTETVVGRAPQGLSSETVVGAMPSAESAAELKTGELEPLSPKASAPRRTGELKAQKAAEDAPKRRPTAEVRVAGETMVASPKAMAGQGGVVPKHDDLVEQVTDRKPALKVEEPSTDRSPAHKPEPKRARTQGEVKAAVPKPQSTVADLGRPSGLLDESVAPGTGENEVFESRTALKLEPLQRDERVSTLAGGTNPSLRVRSARLDRLVIGIVAGALVIVLTAVLIAWGSGSGKKAPPRHRVVQHDEADEPATEPSDEQPVLPAAKTPVAVAAEPAPSSDAGLSGLVRFVSEPAADVFIAGENKGTTPLLLALPAGRTKAIFSCTRLGLKRTVELEVVAGRETEAATVFATGWVELHAKPGAAITVDGKPVANKLLSLLTGSHRIEAKFPSGGVAAETVEVVAGMTITVYLEPDTSER